MKLNLATICLVLTACSIHVVSPPPVKGQTVGEATGVGLLNSSGFTKASASATVKVCPYNAQLQCVGTITLYEDPLMTTAEGNPFNTDANGNYTYYAAPGNYVQQVCFPVSQCTERFVTITVTGSGGGGSGSITTGLLVNIPATCSVGSLYQATDQLPQHQVYDCTSSNIWTLISQFTKQVSAKEFGAVCNGIIDDTAALTNTFAYVNANPGTALYVPGGRCLVNGTLRLTTATWLHGDSMGSTFLVETNPTADLLVATDTGGVQVAGTTVGTNISDITFAGEGPSTTGNLLVLNNGRFAVYNAAFLGHGGRAIMDETERVMLYNIHVSDVRQTLATDAAVASNETYLHDFTIISPGLAQNDLGIGTAGSYCYNVNSTAGVFPPSGAISQDPHTAIDLGQNVANWHIFNGSIKSTLCVGGIKVKASGTTSVEHVYIEGKMNGAVNPSIIYGGNHEKSPTTIAMTTGALTVDITDGEWMYFVGNSQDFASQGTLPVWVIRPPDYIPGSSVASSLGNGILKGNSEYVTFQGIVHDSVTSGWHALFGARAAFSSTAYAWPIGAILEEGWGSPADPQTVQFPEPLHLANNTDISFNTYSGYTLTTNPTAEQTAGEIVVGLEPDTFYVSGSANIRSFQLGVRFDGNNLFGWSAAPQGNVDTYVNATVDAGGSGAAYVDSGGTLASSVSLSGGAFNANKITRETFGGSLGTALTYLDRATELSSSGPSSTALLGCMTSVVNGVKTCTDISTPANPASGATKVYTKNGKECSLSPGGVENCTGTSGGGSTVTWPASGDIVVSNTTDTPDGLAPINGDCITGSGGVWAAIACLTNPMSTQGDQIVGGISGVPTRVAIGTNTFVWTSNGTTASWQAAPGTAVTITAGAGVCIDSTATPSNVPLDRCEVTDTSQKTTLVQSQLGNYLVYSGNGVSGVGIPGGVSAFKNSSGGSDAELDVCNRNTAQVITFTATGTTTINGVSVGSNQFTLGNGKHIRILWTPTDISVHGGDACVGAAF